MKIKVQLTGGGSATRDLLITADAAATVGDVARYLRLADPTRTGGGDEGRDWTLSLQKESPRLLDPRTPLSESPIRSGATISVLPAGQQYSSSEQIAVAVATIVQGPGAGREFPLSSGTNIIGRNRTCEVRIEDPLASRQHARLNVTDHVEIIDLGSANGVDVNGSVISREVLRPADLIRIGDTVLSVRMVQVASAAGRVDGALGFIRSPRLAPRYPGRSFTPPDVPARQQPQPFPIMMLLMPILMAGGMYLATRQWQTLILAGLSPLMMVGSWFEQRRRAKGADKASIAAFRADLDSLRADVMAEHEREVVGRLAEHPSAQDCIAAVHERSPLLWTRRPDQWGFLELRLGTGEMASRCEIEPLSARNAPRDLAGEAQALLDPLGAVVGVPVTAQPIEAGAIGVAGPRSAAVATARALLVQAAALHSPAELAICVLTSTRGTEDWSWLKWLPHVDAPWSSVEAKHLAANPADSAALVSAIAQVIATRTESRESSPFPSVLVLVDSESPVDFGRLVDIAERGRPAGVHVLWVAPEVQQLPAGCHTFIDVFSMSESGVGYVHEGSRVRPVMTDLLGAEAALDFALSLAPVVDLGASNEDASDLPRTISFLSMDGYESMGDSPEAVLERWTQNHSILTGPRACEPHRKAASLRAAVGHTAGHLHQLDLRTDGPHALVGGTTGAGKSELLQTWILSMAANHSPERLTFLLVDYKGGSAFAECDKLPHTVGMVTNLDSNGVQRALKSLTAELDHRMKVLQNAKAKDLMELEKRWDRAAPPSLVIVVDEFAALVQEVPEFVDGVVNVAQRGRSLGLHLILATQRPAGVIKDNLRANTNLRMALRVADEADSTDVLGCQDAAFFDPELPGRAVSKTGAGRLVPFQTAYVGGRTLSGPAAPDIKVEELLVGSGLIWEFAEPRATPAAAADDQTDIARIVRQINAAHQAADLPTPRRPWLEDLSGHYNVADVLRANRLGDVLTFGMVDLPDEQAQRAVAFAPDRSGNLLVMGASGSGKSTTLRTLAVTAGINYRSGPTWVYGLDFGSQGLAMLEELPHVGSIIRANDDERVRRLLRWLREVIDERGFRYAKVNAGTITEYRTVTGKADEPRILLLLDGLGAFLKEYEARDSWVDTLVAIAGAGRAVGVHVVFSTDRSTGMTSALAATIQQRLVLRMASVDDYDSSIVPRGMLTPQAVPGRGVWERTEVQIALLGPSTDLGVQAREMQTLGRALRESGAPHAPEIGSLPDLMHLSSLPISTDDDIVLGVRDDTLGALTFEPHGTFAVCGPPGSGRTNTLLTVAAAFRRARPTADITLLTMDRRSLLIDGGPWSRKAVGESQTKETLESLEIQFQRDAGAACVVVDRVSDWAETSLEGLMERVLKAAVRSGALVVCDADATLLSRTYGLPSVLNGSKTGFILAPDGSEGAAYGAKLPPRLNRGDFPPGRGYFVQSGRASLAHIAVSS